MDENCLCLELKLGLQHQPRLLWASGLTGVHPVCSTPTMCIRNVFCQYPPNLLQNNIYWIPISNALSYWFQLWIPHLTLTQYLLPNFSSRCKNCSSYSNLGTSATSTRSHAVLLLKKQQQQKKTIKKWYQPKASLTESMCLESLSPNPWQDFMQFVKANVSFASLFHKSSTCADENGSQGEVSFCLRWGEGAFTFPWSLIFFLLPLVRKYETEPSDVTILQLCELSFWSKQTNHVTD